MVLPTGMYGIDYVPRSVLDSGDAVVKKPTEVPGRMKLPSSHREWMKLGSLRRTVRGRAGARGLRQQGPWCPQGTAMCYLAGTQSRMERQWQMRLDGKAGAWTRACDFGWQECAPYNASVLADPFPDATHWFYAHWWRWWLGLAKCWVFQMLSGKLGFAFLHACVWLTAVFTRQPPQDGLTGSLHSPAFSFPGSFL